MATPIPGNEARFTLRELCELTGGVALEAAAESVCGVSTSSRDLAPGSLFVALAGERFDGHRFVEDARRAGAALVLVREGSGIKGPRVEVPDTLVALAALARGHLRRHREARALPVVAVGGAAGKTTTKELCAAAMRALWGETLATKGNLNNLVGVPMTALTLGDAHRAAVLECGTNARGEVARLGALAEPDVALLLNVELEHTEGLGSLEGVAEEEGDLLRAARRFAVGNAEDSMVQRELATVSVPTRTFGHEGSSATVRLLSRRATSEGRAQLRLWIAPELRVTEAPEVLEVELGLLGPGPAIDAAAALAAALSTLATPATKAQLDAAARALETVAPVPGRMRPLEAGHLLLLDDTYNANPGSVRMSLAAARELAEARGEPLVLALGDMLELGAHGPEAHREVLGWVREARPALAVLVGPQFAAAASALEGFDGARFVEDSVAAAPVLLAGCPERAVVLLKGSRGLRLERALEGAWPAASGQASA